MTSSFRPRLLPVRRGGLDAAGRQLHRAAGTTRRSSARPAPARRPSATWSRGSTTSTGAASRSTASTCATCSFDSLGEPCRRRHAGDLPPPRDDPREPAPREARRDGRGARRGCRGRAHPPPDRRAAGRLRHGRRRARLPLLRRREAADRDRAHDPQRPADPDPRRGDLRARHRDRSGWSRKRSTGSAAGTDDDRDRAPALDRAGTPTRSSSSTTAGSSSGPPRRAARRRRPLRHARQPRRGARASRPRLGASHRTSSRRTPRELL